MKLNAKIGDLQRSVEIRENSGDLEILVDGEVLEVEVSEPEADTFLFKSRDGIFEAFVSAGNSGIYEVEMGGNSIAVEVSDPKRLIHSGAGSANAEGASEIRSAMPGKVVKLLVAVGDKIEPGVGVIVVEAMKMQNELKSPKAGEVTQIKVAEDDRVNSGDLLVVIE